MRNVEVVRHWKILKRIEAGRYVSTADLALEHDVSERTIRHDLDALQDAGFPIYDERQGPKTVWRSLSPSGMRVAHKFTLSELASLYVAKGLMPAGSAFHQDMESAYQKIRESLPGKCLGKLDALIATLQVPSQVGA